MHTFVCFFNKIPLTNRCFLYQRLKTPHKNFKVLTIIGPNYKHLLTEYAKVNLTGDFLYRTIHTWHRQRPGLLPRVETFKTADLKDSIDVLMYFQAGFNSLKTFKDKITSFQKTCMKVDTTACFGTLPYYYYKLWSF